jgi:hypothetical protein
MAINADKETGTNLASMVTDGSEVNVDVGGLLEGGSFNRRQSAPYKKATAIARNSPKGLGGPLGSQYSKLPPFNIHPAAWPREPKGPHEPVLYRY